METAVEFERLVSLTKLEATGTMPVSVRTRYEERLAVLRDALQEQQNEYPLGAILVSIGAITDKQLNRALLAQRQSQTKKLLGEFLVEMNITSREQLSHALSIQASTSKTKSSRIVRSKQEVS